VFVAALGVADHLDDVEAVVLVEGGGDGADDVGLGGGELGAEAGAELEGLDRVFGCDGGEAGEVLVGDFGLGGFGGGEFATEDTEDTEEGKGEFV
jgi:hypothetical protein